MRRKHGFTLVELLVVISIIALLISMLLPSLNKARDAAMSVQCRSNLRQLQMALSMYLDQSRQIIPGARVHGHPWNIDDAMGAYLKMASTPWGSAPPNDIRICPTTYSSYTPYAAAYNVQYVANFLWRSTPDQSPAFDYRYPHATPGVAPPDGGTNDIYHEQCNCFRKWGKIKTPWSYPVYIDPAMGFDWGLGWTVYPSAPNDVYTAQQQFKSYRGVGAQHGRDRFVNASFADGHVETTPLAVIKSTTDAFNDGNAWFRMK